MEKISKGDSREIRIAVKEYKGKVYVDLREWSVWEGQTDFRPSKKGITIPITQWEEFLGIVNQIDTTQIEKGEDIQ